MNKQEASKKISELLAKADKNISDAEDIAREAGVSFSWSGPSYGMGGIESLSSYRNN